MLRVTIYGVFTKYGEFSWFVFGLVSFTHLFYDIWLILRSEVSSTHNISSMQRARDVVSELNQTLNDLIELNALILNSVGDGVYGIDTEGNTTFSNPAAEVMTGWSLADLAGKHSHDVWHHTKADGCPYPVEECPIYAALKDGIVHHEDDELFWRKDGTSFNVEYTSTPMIKGGRIVGAVVVFRDISQRKQQEQQLKQALSTISELQNKTQAENAYLKTELLEQHSLGDMVASDNSMQALMAQLNQVAPTDASVLIQGETGTGKELIATRIHQRSQRNQGPLIKINCGAIPANLVESELFGHDKGAFTGADQARVGRFELADTGTLFLDEVAELPLSTQTKLLRVLQEGEFERVGSSQTIRVDVRVVSATHKDLKSMCSNGEFRSDLYYRLCVFPLYLPPLRERKSDIPDLANAIIQKLSVKLNKPLKPLDENNLATLLDYPWHGNVRELQNVLERAAILATGQTLRISQGDLMSGAVQPVDTASSTASTLAEVEKAHIAAILSMVNGKISGKGGAAEILGIHPNTLRARMIKLGLL